MAVGDRILTPEGEGYTDAEVTDENNVNGYKQFVRLVKTVDDNGATVNPGVITELPVQAYSASVTLTRTADTNVYAANDAIGSAVAAGGAVLTFPTMGPSAGRIMITSTSLEIDAAAIISGETSYLLHLYDVTPPGNLGDNGAFDLPAGDRASYLGFLNLGVPADLGSTLYVETNQINKQIKLAGTSIFAYLVTVGTYTPTSARVYVIKLHAVGL